VLLVCQSLSHVVVGCAGLCQAKIAAAELWRAYSEHYRSHQARHPVIGVSRHRLHHRPQQHLQQQQVKLVDVCDVRRSASDVESISSADATDPHKFSLVEHLGIETVAVAPDDSRIDDVVGDRHDNGDVVRAPTGCELAAGEGSIASSNSNNGDMDDDFEVEGGDVLAEPGSDSYVWNDHEDDSSDAATKSPPAVTAVSTGDTTLTAGLINTVRDDVDSINTLPENVRLKSDALSAVTQGFNAVSDYQQVSPSSARQLYNVSLATAVGLSHASFNSATLTPPPLKTPKKSPSERQSSSADYRRSERGLSFLFPSFSDHGMSLLDKVRITVARHKNNYFLGWTADQLSRLDPIVRPKLPVTPAVYREYCHRNAMKYDSNLQFACESPEPWAAEFRARLTLPPAEGGFSSLCEVKLEAGRLWREHSGRYRMHNIVKWQMGMNSAVLANGSAAAAAGAAKPSRTRAKTSPSVNVEHQLTPGCAGLARHPSSDASFDQNRISDGDPRGAVFSSMSVSALSSVPINVSPLIVSPPRCVTSSASQSAALDSSTSSCSDVLDMSVSTPSAGSADSGPLFDPLPNEMPAASQLRVWLERHRRGYFVDAARPPAGDPVVDYVRPRRWPVTPALMNAEIPPGVVEVLGKIDHLLSLPGDQLPAPARRFRQRLDAPADSDDAFATFEEAVTEALSAWSTTVRHAGYSNSDDVDSGGAARRRKRKREQPEYISYGSCAGSAGTSDVRVTSNGGSRYVISDGDDDDDDDDDGGLVVALSPSCTASPGQSHSPSPSLSLSVDVVQQLLWSSRSSLHDACVQNPQLSWNERLEPLRPTLTSNVGHDYKTPTESDTAAAVDLVLAMLHGQLEHLARSQARHDAEQLPNANAFPSLPIQ